MKVLQAMAGADYGGAEAFFVRLVKALGRSGLDQHVVIRRNARRAKLLSDGGLDPVELGFGGAADFSTRWAFRREIERFEPDIVLTWMNRASSVCPKPKGRFVHVGRLGGYYNPKYYRRCDHLIANTDDIAEYLTANGWSADTVHYLPNFVESKPAEPEPRALHYTPDSASLILALGRLHPNKAFDVLFEALARTPNTYLWLAGEGPLRAELEALAEKLGIKPRVRFLGWRDDTEALFAAADLFVCPSRHEPLGNVVIEAWAQGVPVISTDSLGPGTLIEQGETGILVPVDDHVSLSMAIRRVFADDNVRLRLARNGRQVYETEFTEDIVVARYMEFFERLIA